MTTYLAVVFASDDGAHQGLRDLWHMDQARLLTMHGGAILRRDDRGLTRVADRTSDPSLRMANGVGVGALLGALTGPTGATSDVATGTRREAAAAETLFSLRPGQSAVLAEISEDSTHALDAVMRSRGGTIHRRSSPAAPSAAFGDNFSGGYLCPYYAAPIYV